MKIVWTMIGGVGFMVLGAAIGFGIAMLAMSFAKPHHDGTDGMREVVVCLPIGAFLGLLGGMLWGWKHAG